MSFPSYDDVFKNTGDRQTGDKALGLLAQPKAGDNAPAMSISEISTALKRTVEDQFGRVRLRGEISGYKRAASGHVYMSLKDDKAVIDGVIWKGNANRLAFAPEDGIEVIATGKLTTYPGRSKYQIVIDSMEIAGEGALMQLFEKLKAKLGEEGLFAPERKKELPYLPRTIGVVTSPTGSVIRDILHRLADRCPSHVIVWPVLVQGEGAAKQIADAVNGFSALEPGGAVPRPDLVIVARGGGSIEDLWSFNEEAVVRAIADCTVPVISAVGHETDTTLADYAADRRAPTPTAAAEIAVPVRADLLAFIDELKLRARRASQRELSLAKERLENQARLMPKLDALLQPQHQKTDDLAAGLKHGLQMRISHASGELAQKSGALRPALLRRKHDNAAASLQRLELRPANLQKRFANAGERLDRIWRLAEQLHPDRPLQRGYARVTDADGQTVTSRKAAAAHAKLGLVFRDGDIEVFTCAADKPLPSVKPMPRKKAGPKKSGSDDGQQSLF